MCERYRVDDVTRVDGCAAGSSRIGMPASSTAIRNRKLCRVVTVALFAALLVGVRAIIAQAEPSASVGSPTIVLPDGLRTSGQRADAPIDILFVTAPDTSVDLTSLHVWVHKLTGWIDVTNSLLSHPQVHVSGLGIHLDAGVLPAGEHQVRLSFHDLKGRVLDATEIIRLLRPS